VGIGCQTKRREEALLGLPLRELGRGGCWAAGRRGERERKKWAAGERKWARGKGRKRGKGLGRGLGELGCQLGCSSLFLFFFSFLFKTTQFNLNSNGI
jgi:hypothetical protein